MSAKSPATARCLPRTRSLQKSHGARTQPKYGFGEQTPKGQTTALCVAETCARGIITTRHSPKQRFRQHGSITAPKATHGRPACGAWALLACAFGTAAQTRRPLKQQPHPAQAIDGARVICTCATRCSGFCAARCARVAARTPTVARSLGPQGLQATAVCQRHAKRLDAATVALRGLSEPIHTTDALAARGLGCAPLQ